MVWYGDKYTKLLIGNPVLIWGRYGGFTIYGLQSKEK
jgi:hypothetical protein